MNEEKSPEAKFIKAVSERLAYIDKIKALYDLSVKATQELPLSLAEFEPEIYVFLSDLNRIRIDFPFNPDHQNMVEAILAAHGWKEYSRRRNEGNADIYIYWKNPRYPGIEFDTCFDASHKHSTCKLVKVGVKTVEQPIYEIECE